MNIYPETKKLNPKIESENHSIRIFAEKRTYIQMILFSIF